ncbi:MAG: hypothetical protein M3354_03425 [Chloroflexota bacterium]|nr:hypothetical protein [Chloroflexota bacterium]
MRRARTSGLQIIKTRHVEIEHARFFGGLNLVGMNTGVVTARRTIAQGKTIGRTAAFPAGVSLDRGASPRASARPTLDIGNESL